MQIDSTPRRTVHVAALVTVDTLLVSAAQTAFALRVARPKEMNGPTDEVTVQGQ